MAPFSPYAFCILTTLRDSDSMRNACDNLTTRKLAWAATGPAAAAPIRIAGLISP